jgi:hypothetical protein
MPATTWRIIIEQGATWRFRLTIAGRDLTGCTARMQIREVYASPTPLLDLTSDPAAGITIDGPAGTITVEISAAQTAALAGVHRGGVYDLELESPDGTVERLLKGDVLIDPEVTR